MVGIKPKRTRLVPSISLVAQADGPGQIEEKEGEIEPERIYRLKLIYDLDLSLNSIPTKRTPRNKNAKFVHAWVSSGYFVKYKF